VAEEPIEYRQDVGDLVAEDLTGFFVGWPAAPTPDQLLRVLQGSYRAIMAMDGDRVVGFVAAVSDGVLTAFVPWLEVRPTHQGRGIGSALVHRMLDELTHLYSVDLTCDPLLRAFYARLGFTALDAMGRRNPAALG
jgi:GNAT superfamily N-acetyltransferase